MGTNNLDQSAVTFLPCLLTPVCCGTSDANPDFRNFLMVEKKE
jgi:hypothetical protein